MTTCLNKSLSIFYYCHPPKLRFNSPPTSLRTSKTSLKWGSLTRKRDWCSTPSSTPRRVSRTTCGSRPPGINTRRMRNLSHGMKETRSRTSRSSTTSSSRPPRASATSPTSGTEGNWKRTGKGNLKLPAFNSKHGSNPTGASPSSSRSPTTSHPPPTPLMRERRTSTKRTTSKLRLLQPKRLRNGPTDKPAHALRSSTWTRSSRPTSSSRPHRKKKGKRWKNTLRSGQKETIPVPSKTSLHWKSPKKLQRTNKRKTLHCPIN